ncbi:MAG: N-acetylmuramoyl-L-alanine amidase [Phyllobacterium sp.]|uniref:N-acetylmuramoyl-L-alanine amidase n=1 Tax=Phyllobacterium sp. TaxID=1871046 RepID=UPI0030F3397D
MATSQEVQERLRALGYYNGKIDGDLGPASRTAIVEALKGVAAVAQPAPLPDYSAVSDSIKTLLSKQPKASRLINEIIVHCTATPEGRAVSVDTIRGWHKAQGWKDIGYHYVVLLDGTVQAGRPEAEIGSHVAGHNTGTLGVVYVGGVAADGKTPKDTRTPAQKAALLAIVNGLIAKYPAVKKVTGHNQYAAKACPSFDVRKDALGQLI